MPELLRAYIAPEEAEVKVVEEGAYLVEAVASTERVDRQGDRIIQSGWDLEEFHKNPVLLSSHNYMSLSAIIGRWESMEVKGKKLVGVARYFVGEGIVEADRGFALARRGMAAFSVGFRPDMSKAKELPNDGGFFPSFEFHRQELLEVSQVSVPANPDARQRMKALAELDPALAKRFDAVLRAAPEGRVPTMDELAERMWERARVDLPSLLRDAGAVLVAGALRPHTSGLAQEDAEWDAGAERTRASGLSALRRMHAWVDPDGDPDSPDAYLLAHHLATGEVVLAGVQEALDNLAAIPEADRKAAYDHLAEHVRQFGEEPPEYKGDTGAGNRGVSDIDRILMEALS